MAAYNGPNLSANDTFMILISIGDERSIESQKFGLSGRINILRYFRNVDCYVRLLPYETSFNGAAL